LLLLLLLLPLLLLLLLLLLWEYTGKPAAASADSSARRRPWLGAPSAGAASSPAGFDAKTTARRTSLWRCGAPKLYPKCSCKTPTSSQQGALFSVRITAPLRGLPALLFAALASRLLVELLLASLPVRAKQSAVAVAQCAT
jgi:hypothetical protein